MATYLIVINVFFIALVVAGICGSLVWAISTQHHAWPEHWHPADRHLGRTRVQAAPEPVEVVLEPVDVVPELVLDVATELATP